MKVLSLFSGGGLGDYGLELAGMEIVGQVEIDDYCQKILNLRWPDVPKWKDIKEVRGSEVLEKCGTVDLISGGFPCQDISVAGKGIGITGEKSGLWKEMHRIICEIRPKFVLVENVLALLHRGLDVVLGDLASCGYFAEWDCIPASSVGAPHRRDRVWIVAYTGSKESRRLSVDEREKISEARSNGKNMAYSEPMGRNAGATLKKRSNVRRSSNQFGDGSEIGNTASERFQDGAEKTVFKPEANEVPERSNWWAVEPNVGRVAHGVPNRVHRLKLLGNGQVVQVVEWIGKRILEFEMQ